MKKIAIISTIVLGLAATSCNNYLDINQDPNSPAEGNMTTSILMPAAEMGIAATYGNLLRILVDISHSTTLTCSVPATT